MKPSRPKPIRGTIMTEKDSKWPVPHASEEENGSINGLKLPQTELIILSKALLEIAKSQNLMAAGLMELAKATNFSIKQLTSSNSELLQTIIAMAGNEEEEDNPPVSQYLNGKPMFPDNPRKGAKANATSKPDQSGLQPVDGQID